MEYLPLLVPIAILAYLCWRADRRYDEAERAWRQERSELLQRIQAPELAPTLTAKEPSTEPLYVPPDDDAAYEAYIEAKSEGRVS